MELYSNIFKELPVGTEFHLYHDSNLTYMKTGTKEALIVHSLEKFYIGLSEECKVFLETSRH